MKFISFMTGGAVADPVSHLLSRKYKYHDSLYPVPDGMTDGEIAAAIARSGGLYPQGRPSELANHLGSMEIFVDHNGTCIELLVGEEYLTYENIHEEDRALVQRAIDHAVAKLTTK